MAGFIISVTAKQDGTTPHRGATVTAGNRSYYLFVTPSYVTVLTGKYTRLGKTFHADARYSMNETDFVKNYKQHGAALLEIVHELRKEISK